MFIVLQCSKVYFPSGSVDNQLEECNSSIQRFWSLYPEKCTKKQKISAAQWALGWLSEAEANNKIALYIEVPLISNDIINKISYWN